MTSVELLRVENLRVPSAPDSTVWNFSIHAGGALWLPVIPGGVSWLDVLLGLQEPEEGRVWWQGRDWRTLRPWEAEAARAEIGIIWKSGGVLSNLDVDENVWLPLSYHRKNAAARVEKWARYFGVWPLPSIRYWNAGDRVGRAALWVRGLATAEKMLMLDRPCMDCPEEERELLFSAVRDIHAAGVAVVWMDAVRDARVMQVLGMNEKDTSK